MQIVPLFEPYVIVVILVKNIKFISPKTSLWIILQDKWPNGYMRWFPKEIIIWRLQVQSLLQASNNTGRLNTCTRLWLTESEQMTPWIQ